MSKLMLINVTHAEESRVGIVTQDVLTAFEIESFSREHLKGNIYRGVVHRIHPALEAAFVDIGGERDAFLPLDEICFRNLPNPPERTDGGDGRRAVRIQEILKPGDELLVQIVKEEFGNKPPTLSTFYSLPGRYLVLLPGSDDAGISRRIEGDERQRIRELLEEIEAPEGFGIIVRTVAGFDQGARELQRDLSYLLRLWERIQHTADQRRAPALVYREHDLVLRNIRDYFTPDVDEIWIDNEEVYERARDFLREVMPDKEEVLRLYEGDKPIFSQFDVETQIESIYKRRVNLRSGGSIVIDGTEALTAIDVNSGRSTRGSNQEDTAYRTNREAALEIARQLRLRDVGGLIVIDFIDMRSGQHIAEVERTLRQAMHEDKARHEVGRISQFGLLEVSRQRLRPAAAATSYLACPMCEGYGLVRTTESAALVGLRKIHNRIAKGDVAALRAVFPPDVGLYLLNQKRDDLAQLERRYACRIQVAFDSKLMPHQFESEVRLRSEGEQLEQKPLRLGGITTAPQQRGSGRRGGRNASARGGRGGGRGAAARGSRQQSAQAESAPPEAEEASKVAVAAAEAPAAPSAEEQRSARSSEEQRSERTDEQRSERNGRRSRRRRGRRRGRGTGVQAANSIAEALLSIAMASPMLADAVAAALAARAAEVDEDAQEESAAEANAAPVDVAADAVVADDEAEAVDPPRDPYATDAAPDPRDATDTPDPVDARPDDEGSEAAPAASTEAAAVGTSAASDGEEAASPKRAARKKKAPASRKKTATKKKAARKRATKTARKKTAAKRTAAAKTDGDAASGED